MPETEIGRSEDWLGPLAEWVREETPTTDARAVNRLMDRAEGELARAGAALTRIPGRDGFGDTLIARTPGRGKPILVAGHLDTVWPPGTLATMPYRVEGDRAYGPGIFDMKAGSFLAFEVVCRIVSQRVRTKRPITLMLTPDEVAFVLNDGGAAAIFTSGDRAEIISGLTRSVPALRRVISFDSAGGDVTGFGDLLAGAAEAPQVPRPGPLCPPPRTANVSSCSRAKLTAMITSAIPTQRTISAGCLLIMPL